ncbi:PorP/SprF family type IX secretion system membrane protein [Ekhidna sp.]|uniref:PorP/SprF family type IX secretion system membrane protein n=1 Tax=Ekhidna sp. TaxID=2608089 RepID=UPI003514D61D
MRYILFWVAALLTATQVLAQQTPIYSQYYMNPYLYNPAAAGDAGTQAHFLYRKQWVNIEGSPETHALTIDGKMDGQPIGLGLTFYNDVSNVLSRSSIGLTSSYSFKLAPDHKLSYGMTFQLLQNRINFDRVVAEDMNDPNLLSRIDQKSVFELSAGLLYRWKQLKIGIAADQLLQNEISYEDASMFRSLNYNLVRHYITTLSHDFRVNENFRVEPIVVIRAAQGLPSQYDGSIVGKYRDVLWSAVGYRHEIGWAFSAGFDVQQIRLGYTYEIPTSDLDQIGGATHELVLGWRFSKGGTAGRGGSSLPSTSGSYQQANTAESQELDELRYKNEKLSQQLEESRDRHEAQESEINKLKERVVSYEGELKELIAQATRELNNAQNAKYYVIISAFKTLEYTKRAQSLLRKEKGLITKVIQNETGSFYLIYTNEYDSLTEALSEAKQLDDGDLNEIIVGNPWVYMKENE